MRVILVAAGGTAGPAPLEARGPGPLLPLVDRPFVQHVVEFLAGRGATDIDVVLGLAARPAAAALGDGARWGVRLRWRPADDPARPYAPLRDLAGEGPVLLGHADRLPPIPHEALAAPPKGRPLLFGRRPRWTGWALLAPERLADLADETDEAGLLRRILASADGRECWRPTAAPLRVRSPGDILKAHWAVLERSLSGLPPAGRETAPGVRLARNARLHPTARLTPPVYVGEDSIVGRDVRLGPHAVVGGQCVLDAGCAVAHAVVLPGSYVGEAVRLSDVIVDENRLLRPGREDVEVIRDELVLDRLRADGLSRAAAALSVRGAALLLLAAAAPALAAVWVWRKLTRRGPAVFAREVVRLPAAPGPDRPGAFRLCSFLPAGPPAWGGAGGWRTLFLHFLPALIHVVRGELSFVGLPPRSPAEVEALPAEWRALYLRGKAGLITEAAARFDAAPPPAALAAAEADYAAAGGWRRDWGVALRWASRRLFGAGRQKSRPRA
jgi:hypothetical protein